MGDKKQNTSGSGIRMRLLFALAALGVRPDNEEMRAEMSEAWDTLEGTPVGGIFRKQPGNVKASAEEWEAMRRMPAGQVFGKPKFLLP